MVPMATRVAMGVRRNGVGLFRSALDRRMAFFAPFRSLIPSARPLSSISAVASTGSTFWTVSSLIRSSAPIAATLRPAVISSSPKPHLALVGGVRFKSKEPAIRLRPRHRKTASVRKGKKYKLKNHRGALTRWLLIRGGQFKRAQAGNHHLNRKNRAWKSRIKRRRVRSTPTQARILRKLMPYWRRRYMR
ncbi:hypothetical protein DFJ73DRAFT_795047 [Zopfochytrium polystomum]|nr:hypothetical protein DFJ73DRAFT_795047 [Zopfochytrium polystomum]